LALWGSETPMALLVLSVVKFLVHFTN